MAVNQKSLLTASQTLSSSNYDVAAGLSDATISDFLDAHFKTEEASPSSVYRGSGRAAELGLAWSYHVMRPAEIDLMPIAPATFSRVYVGWMRTVPELARFVGQPRAFGSEPNERGSLGDTPPPNVQLRTKDVRVEVTTDTGVKVAFDYAVTITGFLQTDMVDGARVIRIVPIAAKVTDPAALTAQVASALPRALAASTDCVALQKLILYLLNVLIANRIGSFVRQFSLPVPIDVVKGVTIADVELAVVDNLLVLMGRLSTTPPAVAPERAALDSGDHDVIMSMAAQSKSALVSLAETHVIPVRPMPSGRSLASWPARGMFVILHERLFQAFAATVTYAASSEQCRSAFGLRGCVGYALRLWGAQATVLPDGLRVSAEFAGSGWVKICIDTHCGSGCEKISANPRATPAFNAVFTIEGRDLWMTASPDAFDISWQVGGLPWPFNKLLAWALERLTDVALLFARVLHVQFRRQITSFPDDFPGTRIRYQPTLDRQVLKDPSQPALMIMGEVDFLP